jgi:hypothetical protein
LALLLPRSNGTVVWFASAPIESRSGLLPSYREVFSLRNLGVTICMWKGRFFVMAYGSKQRWDQIQKDQRCNTFDREPIPEGKNENHPPRKKA